MVIIGHLWQNLTFFGQTRQLIRFACFELSLNGILKCMSFDFRTVIFIHFLDLCDVIWSLLSTLRQTEQFYGFYSHFRLNFIICCWRLRKPFAWIFRLIDQVEPLLTISDEIEKILSAFERIRLLLGSINRMESLTVRFNKATFVTELDQLSPLCVFWQFWWFLIFLCNIDNIGHVFTWLHASTFVYF